MEKNDFILELKTLLKNCRDCLKEVQKNTNKQIQTKKLLVMFESLAAMWFDNYEPKLRGDTYLGEDTIEKYHNYFGDLIELSSKNPLKNDAINLLNNINKDFNSEIIIPIQKRGFVIGGNSKYNKYLIGLEGIELEYMTESMECANMKQHRAAIVLGWCGTVYRIQKKIEQLGFDKFSEASNKMFNIKSGRYKRFTKKFEIHNFNDLMMTVFDSDLLWIIEFLGLIDANEHEKLEICATYRNICGHPGEAKVSPENVDSFFSDISELIFNNSKFQIIQ